MLQTALLPDPSLVRLDHLVPGRTALTLVVSACRTAEICPDCQQPTERVHSRYQRTLAEQPWNGLPGLARRSSRRTGEQARVLALIAYVLGGEAGARTAAELGMPISADTLLRQLRQRGGYQGPAPRVLGVDDFALARGQRYGTLLVDLERGEPIDLLPDRSAQTLETWLKEHPGAEIISRDRGGSYAEGARKGAPEAVQVADRFHLLKNLTDALGDLLGREHAALRTAAQPSVEPDSATSESPTSGTELPEKAPGSAAAAAPWDRRSRREQERSEHSRARREALYHDVLGLHQQGQGAREIARQLGISRTTVNKYLAAPSFPERKVRATPDGKLAPHAEYLRQRWEAGCQNSRQLWEELRERGYTGQPQSVWRFTKPWRDAAKLAAGPKIPLGTVPAAPAPRSVVWWLLCPQKRTVEQTQFVDRLETQSAEIRLAHDLVGQFFALVRERKAAQLEAWVARVEQSNLSELASFARGLRKDWAAVVAGLTLPWSNGPVEGQINRLKLIKRQMYGRAGIAVLRGRVLPGTAPA